MNHTFIFVLLTLLTFKITAQQIVYLNGLFENSSCEVDTGIYGRCRKTSDCMSVFESYRKNQTVLKICKFDSNHYNTLICCYDDLESEIQDEPENLEEGERFDEPEMQTMHPKNRSDLIDFSTCQQRFLRFRKHVVNIEHFEDAFWTGKIPQTEENCIKINNLNRKFNYQNFWDGAWYGCEYVNGEFRRTKTFPHFSKSSAIQKSVRPNLAIIGIKQPNGKIMAVCEGSILTPRFIVTAAHCEYHGGKQVDFIKVGIKHAGPKNNQYQEQESKIRKFIVHPDYQPGLSYNDIAIVKTVERISFNKFVVPSCIADFNGNRFGIDNDLKVGGYEHPEDGLKPKVKIDLKVDRISNDECNRSFFNVETLPKGVIDSQFCVQRQIGADEELQKHPNACFAKSGSPVQYNTAFEKFPKNYTTTFLSKYFLTSNVLGIANLQLNCRLETPFVFTKLSYYVPWIEIAIESN